MRTRAKLSRVREARKGAAGSSTARQGPSRTCIVCRQLHHRSLLIRLVCDLTGQIIVDAEGKLPGRGAYICPQRACAERVVTGTRLREALRHEVLPCAAAELVRIITEKLQARVLASIRIARKAGYVVSGYSRVMHALQSEPVALLFLAEDGAPDRRREYTAWCEKRGIPYRSLLTKARLGELVGRDECSAVGIQETRLAERLTFYLQGVSRLMER